MNFTEEKLREGFTKHHIHGLSRSAVIHVIEEVDGDLAHDHPHYMDVFVISGGYWEKEYFIDLDGSYSYTLRKRMAGDTFRINAGCVHRIVQLILPICETLILPGPWEREWGMWSFADGKATFIKP